MSSRFIPSATALKQRMPVVTRQKITLAEMRTAFAVVQAT